MALATGVRTKDIRIQHENQIDNSTNFNYTMSKAMLTGKHLEIYKSFWK